LIKWLLVLVVGVVVIDLFTPWLARFGLGGLPATSPCDGAESSCGFRSRRRYCCRSC
jgi:hypothetical protein